MTLGQRRSNIYQTGTGCGLIRIRNPGFMPLAAGGILIPSLSVAEPSAQNAQMAAGYLTQLVGGLALVILVIIILAWILRRMPGVPGQGPQVIEILAVRAVGARERLLLVQIGEEQILVGLTPTGMRHLHTLRQPVERPSAEDWPSDFAGLLNRVRAKTGPKA
ncbi:flagellar protein FliO/FliZ [Thiobaca trueperi]|uniref:Flagellar protein n=2 Tax=Thiobaca trueperi TaxID=127458 RepID=A0A4R3N048_9GAMM|nr:flagellar protein FliO/FliZ [Thiobaca trueperi]